MAFLAPSQQFHSLPFLIVKRDMWLRKKWLRNQYPVWVSGVLKGELFTPCKVYHCCTGWQSVTAEFGFMPDVIVIMLCTEWVNRQATEWGRFCTVVLGASVERCNPAVWKHRSDAQPRLIGNENTLVMDFPVFWVFSVFISPDFAWFDTFSSVTSEV